LRVFLIDKISNSTNKTEIINLWLYINK